jgi:DNA-binding NtrC family response regulator
MTRLIADRYCLCGPREACDLATGAVVPVDDTTVLRAARDRPLDALLEVLDRGRDGVPRWVVADAASAARARSMMARAADDGQARGFVPVAVDLYHRLGGTLREELADRTLLLLADAGVPPGRAGAALLDAAAASPRPHVLFTVRQAKGGLSSVREARAVYGAGPVPPVREADLPPDVRAHVARAAQASGLVALGRHAAAERLWREVAGMLTRRRAFAAAAQVSITLARELLHRGRAADADAMAGEAAGLARTAGAADLETHARIWQAAARADRAQLTGAEALCRALLLNADLTGWPRAWAAAVLARVLLWQRRGDEAAAIDLDAPDASWEPQVATYVRSVGVRVALERGQLFAAGLLARQAIQASGTDPRARVIAAIAHLRVIAMTGDQVLAGERLAAILELAKQAHLPLATVRARLVWGEMATRSGSTGERTRQLRSLQRIRLACPPLLRQAVDDLAARPAVASPWFPAAAARAADGWRTSSGGLAAALITMVQEEEGDLGAVRRSLEFLQERLGAGRVDLWSAEAGPASIVASRGAGLATTLGPRVLEAGIAIHEEATGGGLEVAVPIRLGPRLVGTLAARWPVDATAAPSDDLLILAAAAIAARVDGLHWRARAAAQAATAIPELVGCSAAMDDVRKAIARAAAAPFPVLIEGESGVGKELVARAIHQLSNRRDRRCCDINCAALPDELLESELFGHARGAFTGALTDRRGLFEDADGGTLLLDEVADLSPRAQAKLLRVLQQHEVRRLGETFTRRVDVRIVSAANRDLHAEVATGRFRQDLLYRLDVIRLRIPPLRERAEDVALLAEHFWHGAAARVGTAATLSHGVLAALARHHWPGNVRELQNVIAALAVNAPRRGRVIASQLPAAIAGAAPSLGGTLVEARERFERRYVEVALARAGARRSRAARELGLTRQGLLKAMKRLGL